MRQLPDPGIFLMHGDLSAVKPAWGPCGMWRWLTWAATNPANGVYKWEAVDAYLDACATQGRKAAISILLYPDLNQDTTPAWVYGGGAGWPIVGGTGTFPKWNDYLWDAAMAQFITAFGKRYDGDPRLHSVWITFAKYGETVTDGLGSDLHNPGRYFANVINWYDAAFPNTPLAALITGPTNRLDLARMCWERGIMPKFNALARDLPTHVQLKPTAGAGHAEIARKSRELGIPVAWEHYYPNNAKETYWAVLTFLGLGGTVLDLPAAHLDTLAAIPGLWDWALEVMQTNQELVGFYAARDTQYPAPGNGWEHGWPGPWERNITTSAVCYAPGSADYKAAPTWLTGTMEGWGGIGRTDGPLSITLDLPAGEYDLEVTYCPPEGAEWMTFLVTATAPSTITLPTGACWLHRVIALPATGEPEPEPPPDADLTEIRRDIETLTALTTSLDMAQDAQAERLAELDAALVRLESRIAALEDSKAEALEALGQLRESLV